MYEIVKDENEMKWFFDHIITPPAPCETYMVCLAARNKRLDDAEREKYTLGRGEMMRTEIIGRKGGEWNFNIYKQAPYKYNCSENAMLTKTGIPYPAKALVCYAYVNPCDELDCVHDTFQFYNNIQHELLESYKKNSKDGVIDHLEKLPKIFEHLRSCHANNLSRRIWRDFDCDIKDFDKKDIVLEVLKKELYSTYGVGNVVIIDTAGGFHSLVRVSAIHSNPNDFIKAILQQTRGLIQEIKLTNAGSQFVPLPGTLQYERLVTVVNKDDFKEN